MKLLKNTVHLAAALFLLAILFSCFSKPSTPAEDIPELPENIEKETDLQPKEENTKTEQEELATQEEISKTEKQKAPFTEEELLKSYETYYQKENIGIENLDYFTKSYPEIIFQKEYDEEKKDWLITIITPEKKETKLYWNQGRLLPESELENKDEYWSLLTYYAEEVRDPVTYTEKERKLIREAGRVKNRSNAKKTPNFFFNAIYDTETRNSTESHIKTIKLFGKYTNVHEKIIEPLKRAEKKVYEAAKKSPELQSFLNNLKSCDSYAWRPIETTESRSLHSMGIAIDFLPKKTRKHLFWGWARDRFPETWMDISLDSRWLLPDEFVEIFAEEGFVWGGRWVIWDNMHLEYRPEQLAYNKDVFWK